MKLVITMNLDSAALQDRGTDEAKRAIAAALERVRGCWPSVGGAACCIYDVNGKRVGVLEIIPD